MLLWLNGPFGVGKTTTAREIVALAPGSRLFDPEWVGFMLRANLANQQFDDFQDLPPWRTLVPRVADEIRRLTGENLIVVQTVLNEQYWSELRAGFDELALDVFHVLLDIEDAALRARIADDGVEAVAKDWRLAHVEPYLEARGWMTTSADQVVDVTAREPRAAANTILSSIGWLT